MVDRKIMRSLLENMEQAAEETLRQDAAFYEALRALKWEIDHDPLVLAAIAELRAAGRSVFQSFVPRVKIRVRTEEGIFGLPCTPEVPVGPAVLKVSMLVKELRDAASVVIKNSRHYRELDVIVNDVIESNHRFEEIAAEIEDAGYEVLVCLDLSAYAQVQGIAASAPSQRPRTSVGISGAQPQIIELSGSDRKFLKGMKIKVDPELPEAKSGLEF